MTAMRFLILSSALCLTALLMNATNIYDFTVAGTNGDSIRLDAYMGKVLLVVNTASRCGFTPQYEELETMYKELHDKGLEILDFPCNQFGQQAPEDDNEYVAFCQLNYHTEFAQFHKIEVNGANEIPLYTWLKSQLPFEGFDADHKLTPLLENMFDQNIPGWRETPDIKWNFTKFLIDRQGKAIKRFEPTAGKEKMMPCIKQLLAE